jgi:hypothetical protein
LFSVQVAWYLRFSNLGKFTVVNLPCCAAVTATAATKHQHTSCRFAAAAMATAEDENEVVSWQSELVLLIGVGRFVWDAERDSYGRLDHGVRALGIGSMAGAGSEAGCLCGDEVA